MELEAYPIHPTPPQLVPGRVQRGWMEAFTGRHAYRCLPLNMANTSGWELLSPYGFSATWNGGNAAADITFEGDPGQDVNWKTFVKSHFTLGVMTFHVGYLFRTPPGFSMWVKGAPNHMKDGVQALEGLVETDWLPYTFTMNWRFTRPGTVRFEKHEPFCFITLVEDRKLEDFTVAIKDIEANEELNNQYEAWIAQREAFNAKRAARDEETLKEAWQKFYFKGEYAGGTADAHDGHRNKRRLATPKKV